MDRSPGRTAANIIDEFPRVQRKRPRQSKSRQSSRFAPTDQHLRAGCARNGKQGAPGWQLGQNRLTLLWSLVIPHDEIAAQPPHLMEGPLSCGAVREAFGDITRVCYSDFGSKGSWSVVEIWAFGNVVVMCIPSELFQFSNVIWMSQTGFAGTQLRGN